MTVTAILCLATLAAVVGSDGTASNTDPQIREALKRSCEAEKSRDYGKGIEALLEQYRAHSGHYALSLRLGWLHYLDGKQDQAERYYKAAVEAAPKSIEAKLGYLLPLLAAAKYDETETLARRIIAVDAENYYGNLRLAVALRLQNKATEAREIVERMLAAYPTDSSFLAEAAALGASQNSVYATANAKVLAAIGESSQAEAKGDYAAAIKALAVPYHVHPKDYLLNLRAGWLYYLARDYAKSAQYYHTATVAATRSIEAKLGAMLAGLAQEKYTVVEAQGETLLQRDRGNYYGNLRLAVALRLQKKYASADKIVQRMLAAYPNDVYWLNESGQLSLAEGKKEAAQRAFTDVLALDPENYTATQAMKGL